MFLTLSTAWCSEHHKSLLGAGPVSFLRWTVGESPVHRFTGLARPDIKSCNQRLGLVTENVVKLHHKLKRTFTGHDVEPHDTPKTAHFMLFRMRLLAMKRLSTASGDRKKDIGRKFCTKLLKKKCSCS